MLAIVLGVLAVLALCVGAAIVLARSGGDDAAQGEGEVFLVAADDPGPDAFSTEAKVAPVETTAPPTTAATTAPATTAKTTLVGTRSGGTPGLYGGTKEVGRCDTTQLVSFLAGNQTKAQAWVGALNADPSLRWSGGRSLTTADISTYVDELTPVTLASDTRVTNHGYRNGRATRLQAVLQAGTAVLVDSYGVPRVKCGCGNPLTAPAAVKGTVRYTGNRWPRFNPASITVVISNTTIINNFVLVNLSGPGYLSRPTGSDGSDDTKAEPTQTTTTTGVPGTTEAPTTTAAETTTTVAQGDFCEVATPWLPKFRNWVLTGFGSDTFPDPTEVIAGVDALLPLSPSPAITKDLQDLRAFLLAPSAAGAEQDLASLHDYLRDTCHLDVDS